MYVLHASCILSCVQKMYVLHSIATYTTLYPDLHHRWGQQLITAIGRPAATAVYQEYGTNARVGIISNCVIRQLAAYILIADACGLDG